jgi:hypothetical protein
VEREGSEHAHVWVGVAAERIQALIWAMWEVVGRSSPRELAGLSRRSTVYTHLSTALAWMTPIQLTLDCWAGLNLYVAASLLLLLAQVVLLVVSVYFVGGSAPYQTAPGCVLLGAVASLIAV